MKAPVALLLTMVFAPALVVAADWPMWGRDKTRNMVSPEKNPPVDWQVELRKDGKTSICARLMW